MVGWIEGTASLDPKHFWVRLAVDPAFRRRGIGSALLRALVDARPEADRFSLDYREDNEAAARFVADRGFQRKNLVFESVLDLKAFDPSSWQEPVDRLRATGLRIATMAELGDDESARYRFWDLEHTTDHDIPGVDPTLLIDWNDAQKIVFGSSYYDPAGEFVAMDGETFVSLSGVGELSPGRFYNQHTCTHRDYRGRGIALGLKVLALAYAKERGGDTCRTNNHSENAPMLAINRKLGYVPQPGTWDATLHIAAGGGNR